jgi:uncharacterized membrane protein YidH (DUF202 family)
VRGERPASRTTHAAYAAQRTDDPLIMTVVTENDPRVFFAAERTLLAWIRTALALMGLGFVVARFDILTREPMAAALLL